MLLLLIAAGIPSAARAQGAHAGVNPANGKQMDASDLKARLDANAKTIIIDVRDADEFKEETIPGAINIPLERLDAKLSSLSKDAFVVFVCDNGNRSSRAAKLAVDSGFSTALFCLIRDWKNKGYKTVRGRAGR